MSDEHTTQAAVVPAWCYVAPGVARAAIDVSACRLAAGSCARARASALRSLAGTSVAGEPFMATKAGSGDAQIEYAWQSIKQQCKSALAALSTL